MSIRPIIIDDNAIEARSFINALLRGEVTEQDVSPECGPWQPYIRNLAQSYADGYATSGLRGAQELVAETLRVYRRTNAQIDFLMGGGTRENAGSEFLLLDAVPPLPDNAYIAPEIGVPARRWMDAYIAFSTKWAPRGHALFHEAIAIWLLSMIAARRILIPIESGKFTPLYVVLAAESGAFTKTTTIKKAREVLKQAGLDFLLLPKKMTPQAFYQMAAGHLPPEYESATLTQQELMLQRIRFAGKRAWIYDEFGGHLKSIGQTNGIMHGFHEIFLEWEDCPDTDDNVTIQRGADAIEEPHLSLLASMTPENVLAMPTGTANLWMDGFWGRMAVITPPADEPWKKDSWPTGIMEIPENVWKPLAYLHEILGTPEISVQSVQSSNSKEQKGKLTVERMTTYPRRACVITDEVLAASQRYDSALHDMLEARGVIHKDLRSNYLRFNEKAMRIAALLSWMDNGGRIEIEHWAAAQTIAEHWRNSIHHFHASICEGEVTLGRKQEDSILRVMEAMNNRGIWPSLTEINQRTRLSTKESKGIIDSLIASQMVIPILVPGGKAGNRPYLRYGLQGAAIPDQYEGARPVETTELTVEMSLNGHHKQGE